MAKVKIQLDLTKPQPHHVWMGFDEDENRDGRWQLVQFEGVLEFYTYCKHQGHNILTCTIKKRDDDFKKKNEQEVAAVNDKVQHQNIRDNTKNKSPPQSNISVQQVSTLKNRHEKKM